MVLVGGPRAEQTHKFWFFKKKKNEDLRTFGEVFVDLVPKVAQILQKVAPNPWGFGLDLWGSPNRAHTAL